MSALRAGVSLMSLCRSIQVFQNFQNSPEDWPLIGRDTITLENADYPGLETNKQSTGARFT